MKGKLLGFIVVLTILLAAGPVLAQQDIKVYISGQSLVSDVQPIIYKDRVLVPVRGVFEADQ